MIPAVSEPHVAPAAAGAAEEEAPAEPVAKNEGDVMRLSGFWRTRAGLEARPSAGHFAEADMA